MRIVSPLQELYFMADFNITFPPTYKAEFWLKKICTSKKKVPTYKYFFQQMIYNFSDYV